jgi:DNA recombination protein RmuC
MDTTTVLIGALALLVGLVNGWLLSNNRASNAKAVMLAEKDGLIKKLENDITKLEGDVAARKEALETARKALVDTFKSAANEALKTSSTQFLELAKTKLDGTVKEAEGDLDERKSAIEELLKPLKESIEKHKERTDKVEKESMETFGKVATMLTGLKDTQGQLERQTGALVTALKNPRVRGRWGEIGLKRIVEFSGMSDHCHFTEQTNTTTEEGRLRPDMIVNLPNDRNIIVDSKLPLDAFMEALEAPDDVIKEALIVRHAQALRGHMNQLSKKEYWSHFEGHADFVVLYIEVESAFSAALEKDRTLIEDGLNNRVIFATPTTLIAILRSIAITWQQHELTANAQLIADTAAELHDRLGKYAEHMAGIGKGLAASVKAYNGAIGSWEGRVLPSGRRLEELHGKLRKQSLEQATQIELSIRVLNAPPPEDEAQAPTAQGQA